MIIKICGVQNIETLLCCEKNDANFFGMIFYEKSPRNISIEKAIKLQQESMKMKINGVGVFVDNKIEDLKKYIRILDLKYVQLHGNEDNIMINEIKELNVKVIKKISIKNKNDIKSIKNFDGADYFLFDYKPRENELPGGNSKSFDWNIINNLKLEKPWFLSGGINISNIQFIKSKIKPYGIDLSSGVEIKLGIKDNHIINNFMEKLKYA
tara:strand:- start:618 stop:1247 length:630 start_codon:yes stop_codon:yes gene_type:complete